MVGYSLLLEAGAKLGLLPVTKQSRLGSWGRLQVTGGQSWLGTSEICLAPPGHPGCHPSWAETPPPFASPLGGAFVPAAVSPGDTWWCLETLLVVRARAGGGWRWGAHNTPQGTGRPPSQSHLAALPMGRGERSPANTFDLALGSAG